MPLTGRVLDGPIVGGVVYLDTNNNNRIDDSDFRLGETDENGQFLHLQVPLQHTDSVQIVDLKAAYDTDSPTITLSGTWLAPAKSLTISPLTEFMVRDDFSNAELAGRFGLPVLACGRFYPKVSQY